MAECGIKRFDELPAVVRGIDVDALRAFLKSPNLARFFLRYTFRTKEWIEADIIGQLEEAYKYKTAGGVEGHSPR